MKILSKHKFLFLYVIFVFAISTAGAQENKRYVRNPEKDLFGKSLNNKKVKVKESRSVVRAKKKQASAERKQNKQYADLVKRNRTHALEIQSPEVHSRMKQNRKEADTNYKIKKKRVKENTKKAGRKYGK